MIEAPSVQTFSIQDCSIYFSTIDWILVSIVKTKSSPEIGSVCFSPSVPTSSPLAFWALSIYPSFPFNILSYLASIPSKPWLSLPQNPIICDAKFP